MTITYQEPNYPVYGSFNHTRKLTRATQERFGAVLSANPDAVLQFRSHSFHDPAVRRYFLQRFSDLHCCSSTSTLALCPLIGGGDGGLRSHPSPSRQLSREWHHHHPGFTCHGDPYSHLPNARTTQGQFLLPFFSMPVERPCLPRSRPSCRPTHVGWRIVTAAVRSRRELAQHVRQSPICDAGAAMPRMFVEQLVSDAASETGSLSFQAAVQVHLGNDPAGRWDLVVLWLVRPTSVIVLVCSAARQSPSQAGRITPPERAIHPRFDQFFHHRVRFCQHWCAACHHLQQAPAEHECF